MLPKFLKYIFLLLKLLKNILHKKLVNLHKYNKSGKYLRPIYNLRKTHEVWLLFQKIHICPYWFITFFNSFSSFSFRFFHFLSELFMSLWDIFPLEHSFSSSSSSTIFFLLNILSLLPHLWQSRLFIFFCQDHCSDLFLVRIRNIIFVCGNNFNFRFASNV